MDENNNIYLGMKIEYDIFKRKIYELIDNSKENEATESILSGLEKIIDELDVEKDLKPEIVKYSAELIKIYFKEQDLGIAMKVEFENENITNIDGFCLDFNNRELQNCEKDELELIYQYLDDYKSDPTIQISAKTLNNKELLDLQFDDIKENFIQNYQETTILEDEEEEE